jgi:putative addiction module killer protein
VYEIRKTDVFIKWLDSLNDLNGRARVLARIKRLESGHHGDAVSVGGGVLEMRIHFGPGYRIYYTRVGKEVILLLAGGDKSTQSADVKKAIRMTTKI